MLHGYARATFGNHILFKVKNIACSKIQIGPCGSAYVVQ